ncbi:MAG TPA: LacI family DNA-binding transcriptional regulator [Bacteroidales bacterium]|mgnify:CR=1 FL=1|jgi:LacI family transcriptional regulator|nr:substrate-binding domain-containing protein [Bacteroidales bacterium]OQB65693.1 MAG: HTH-type transcriptional regulator DegA [Bacteroidetes bacterium ADurb.Bin145]NMD04113.1 LacI family transcriptional regulator [Bacteroidales bacterium]HOU02146.1 LacI family DNA-binding transcriptional regulator [Bacteroidales bacterium]HQG64074.1 LacI family DNA-binding transcriptional regulator [Bacteroidales bacterium]
MAKKFKNKDLAARLGVSGTLVSLVLNNKADLHGIRKETQEKVLALARQMGFFNPPDVKGAVFPVEEKPGVIGMIVPSLSDPFVLGITPFLQKAFMSIGVGFSIVTRDTDDQRFDRMISAFRKFFSGLILVGQAADESTIRTLRATDYPFIVLEKAFKTGRFNTINTDTGAGAQSVAEHVKKLGYKNVVLVTDRESAHNDVQIINELIDALEKTAKINRPEVVEIEKSFLENHTDFDEIEKYLRPPYRTDIFIVLHSGIVYPLMSLLRRKKLRIPQDIALISIEEGIGFDLVFTPVTCLRKPLAAISTKAANMVWSEVKNAGKSKFKRQVSLAPELVIRNSCGTITSQ